jgi:hypothetical protein
MMVIAVDSSGIGGGANSIRMNGLVANDHDGAGNLSSNGARWSRKRDLGNRCCCLSILESQESVSYTLQLLLLDVQVKLGREEEHKLQLIEFRQAEATDLQVKLRIDNNHGIDRLG